MATCPEKQVVLSVLCSMLNTVSLAPLFAVQLLTRVDPEVQPCDMASTIRPCSLQRPEANTRHLLLATPPSVDPVPHT